MPRELASQEALERARMQLDIARAGVDEAKQRLELLREGPRRETIEQARAELEAHRAAVATAERRLGYTRLKSPVSGIVEVRLAESGEVLAAGQPVLRIAELDAPWVRAYLPEPDLARVQLGQSAQVRVDGLPGQILDGTLSFIAAEAEFTPKTVETRELRVDLVYRVKIRLNDPQGRLKIGMPADVTLQPQTSSPRP
ncbi:MAG: HlyD family efflux transporter periplasmic adaptor subunit [Gammaproteobacteria bacterium]|nr:HlyD family efflux transporter periplasmic adaptor subunit [Gammaproteobacteria bacterium]